MRILAVLLPFLFFVAVSLNQAMAQTKPILRVGPGYADSSCIGDTSTPVCTVETWLACNTRRDAELCAKAIVYLKKKFELQGDPYHLRYQISAIRTLTPEQITEVLSEYRIKPGDVEVRLRRYYCHYEDGNCNRDSPVKESYFLTLQKDRWVIAVWTRETAPWPCDNLTVDGPFPLECVIFIYTDSEPWVHDSRVSSKME